MTTPQISVIMPVYNVAAEYLREAMASILTQTFTDFELLIIDDGSTNADVEATIKHFVDPRIIYHYQAKRGIAAALNRGLDLARGDYIARMDGDDWALSERLARQYNFLQENPDISLVGTAIEKFPSRKVVRQPSTVRYLTLLRECCFAHPTVMWRRADFARYALRYDEKYTCAQDYELWSRAIRYVKMANLSEVLLHYRCHAESVSASKNALQETTMRAIRQQMLAFLTADPYLQNAVEQLCKNGGASLATRIFSLHHDNRHTVLNLCGLKIRWRKK